VTVVFWVDAGPGVGLGHVSRGLALAAALEQRGVRARFVLPPDPTALDWLRAAGHRTAVVLDPTLAALPQVGDVAAEAAAVVVDVRHPLALDEVRALGSRAPVVTIDNDGPGTAEADLVIALTGNAGPGRLVGPTYVPIRSAVDRPRPRSRRRPIVLVSLGAADPDGTTVRVVDALAKVQAPATIRVVANPRAPVWEPLALRLERLGLPAARPVAPGGLAAQLAAADVAVLAVGVSVYEALAAGVPSVVLARTAGDVAHARTLAAAGALVSLGRTWHGTELTAAVESLVADRGRRTAMACAARTLVDGRGAERIAARLVEIVVEEGMEHAGRRRRA
jgi:spore coat polysaccharide biosynthesis predicted glycosyltransferase SpsG